MQNMSINRQYKSRAVRSILPTIVKRGETKVIELSFKNIGKATWYDIGKKRLLPTGHQSVILQRADRNVDDFQVKIGEQEDKTDKKFKRIKHGKTEHHIAKPGQTILVSAMVTAKKFTRRGKHNVTFRLGFLDGSTTEGFEVVKITIWVWFFSREIFWRDIKRYWKLIFYKPGGVSYFANNEAFASLKKRSDVAPVIMCTWKRPENLKKTIELLRQQSNPTVFYIWNNNKEISGFIDKTIRAEKELPIYVSHSKYNIGGYGRFYQAKAINNNYPYVIFVDDDQTFDKDMVKNFLKEAQPKTIHSQWAFKFESEDNYWRKRQIMDGEQANYIGTCGMICDSNIFDIEKTFTCPKRFWYVEDLWLSYVADINKWNLKKTKVIINTHKDGKDQMNKLVDKKTQMLKFLVKKAQWRIFTI